MYNDLTFNPALREIVSPELRHGEKLLWIGKPTPLRVITQQSGDELLNAVVVVAMIIFLSLVFPFGMMSFQFSGFSFPLFTLIFGVLLVYSLARPAYTFWQATRTVYALTDYRALILKPTFGGMSTTSYPSLQRVERHSLANDKGDLIFATETYSARGRYGYRTRRRKIGFFGIPDVRHVEDLMLENIPTAQYPNVDD